MDAISLTTNDINCGKALKVVFILTTIVYMAGLFILMHSKIYLLLHYQLAVGIPHS